MRKRSVANQPKEAGFVTFEMSGSMLLYLIMMAAAAALVYSLMSSSKLASTNQALMSLRLQIQQLYSGGSDYAGLDNGLALKSGLVPKSFLRGTKIQTPWGGDVVLSASGDGTTFAISLGEIPQEECTKLATSQLESWSSVSVNGTPIDRTTGASSAARSCNDSNTIVFTSR